MLPLFVLQPSHVAVQTCNGREHAGSLDAEAAGADLAACTSRWLSARPHSQPDLRKWLACVMTGGAKGGMSRL